MEVNDRIFSTSVDLEYTFAPVVISPPKDGKKLEFVVPDMIEQGSVWDEKVAERARRATLEVFAKDESASVQVRYARSLNNEKPGVLGCCGIGSSELLKHEIRRWRYIYVLLW